MLQRAIHSLERAYWRAEKRRATRPFAWGLELVGGDARRDDPRAFFRRYADEALAASDSFFAAGPAEWYQLADGRLTFPSALESPFPENNLVTARWFPATGLRNGQPRRAVVVLSELEGLDTHRVAQLLGVAVVTVRWHLAAGRRELGARLLPGNTPSAQEEPK